MTVASVAADVSGSFMAKAKKKKINRRSLPPRPDKMPGPIKYKKATGDSEPSMLEIASMRKMKKITSKRR